VVQVERKRIGWKHPVLTTKLKVVGNYAILTQNNKIGVSLKIRDFNKRAQLYVLGKELAPDGWGIIWREPSAHQPKEKLENEIAILAEKVKSLNERVSSDATTLLVEGLYFMDVEFPSASKRKMDELRASATPTLSGHHFYKSCEGKVSVALEMAENLLEKGQNKDEVEELFKQQILYEFPEVGSMVDVEHVKLSGLVLRLGQATIESLDDEQIKYSRTMRCDGFYDGLGIQKEAGDIAMSETKNGKWYIITKYFSKSGELKGTYINLNTPVEVYPKTIRYVDLEVDVCIQPDGNVKVLDMEKLEKALEKGVLSRALFEKVKEKVKEATESNFIKRITELR
jgi:Ribonuclease G/E